MEVLTVTGTLEIESFYQLPAWQQAWWLGHVYNRITGVYAASEPAKGSGLAKSDIMGAIEAARDSDDPDAFKADLERRKRRGR